MMVNLVGYSSSEDSEAEAGITSEGTPNVAQPGVQTLNPLKSRIDLPPLPAIEQDQPEGPPAKRQRTDGAKTFGGLSSFLPAPKRSAGQTVAVAAAGGVSTERNKASRAPFSFKTSHEAAFERSEGTTASSAAADAALAKVLNKKKDRASPAAAHLQKIEVSSAPVKKPMLRPLSVETTRKKPKKKKAATAAPEPSRAKEDLMDLDTQIDGTAEVKPTEPVKAKVSLFSTDNIEHAKPASVTQSGDYRPMLLEDEEEDEEEDEGDEGEDSEQLHTLTGDDAFFVEPPAPAPSQTSAAPTDPQTLESIYVNLSESERRQLFGRKGAANISALGNVQVKNFNADAEYSANEALRALGEQQEVKAVRPINPGKHSLRQLVNVAVSQKDALEDSYARGASNKREGGSKYGW